MVSSVGEESVPSLTTGPTGPPGVQEEFPKWTRKEEEVGKHQNVPELQSPSSITQEILIKFESTCLIPSYICIWASNSINKNWSVILRIPSG